MSIRRYMNEIFRGGVIPSYYIPVSGSSTYRTIELIHLYTNDGIAFTSVPSDRVLKRSSFNRIYESKQNDIQIPLDRYDTQTLGTYPFKTGLFSQEDTCLIVYLYEYEDISIPFMFCFGITIPPNDIRQDIYNKLGIRWFFEPHPSEANNYYPNPVMVFTDIPV